MVSSCPGTIFALVVLLSACVSQINGNSIGNSRIVGGSATSISNVKYLVSLRIHGKFSCGGSLVTTTYVVTAAHCVKGIHSKSITVVGGATYLSQTGVRRQVSKIVLPKAYNARTMHMDVAVLKLSSAMTGTDISTIELCNSSWKPGDLIRVSGWGLTSATGATVPNQVRTVTVPLISKDACIAKYKRKETLTKSMFCASVAGAKDSCSGDSGGPAVFEGRLCGIVSWGIGCASSKYPGVYTNIKVVKKFIEKAMEL